MSGARTVFIRILLRILRMLIIDAVLSCVDTAFQQAATAMGGQGGLEGQGGVGVALAVAEERAGGEGGLVQ